MSIARVFALVALLVASVAARANPDPQLGRFLQRDPNASGQLVLNDKTWFHGRAPYLEQPTVSIRAMYGDGMNLYEYLGSNPLTRSDPMGLSWDPFDMIDGIIGEHQMSGALALGKINAFFRDKDVLRKIRAYEAGGFLFGEMIMDRDEGILLGLIIGPFGARACFVEGTLVTTADGMVPIEKLALAQGVTSQPDPNGGNAGADAAVGVPVNWSVVTLTADRGGGATTTVELLRPASWVSDHGLTTGATVRPALAELQIDGPATVQTIAPFAGSVPDDVPIVTARYVTTNSEVVRVFLEGSAEPIGVTPAHPVYSADRKGWVAAGDLRVCEKLRTLNGAAVVSSIERDPARHTVHNIEVARTHTYFVSNQQVLVHNECANLFDLWKSGKPVQAKNTAQWLDDVFENLIQHHGANRAKLSEALHHLKRSAGLGGADKVFLGRTGDVWDSAGNYLGNLLVN